MKTTVIKTPQELLDLRNSKGIIEIEGNLQVECDIPWNGVGETIIGLVVSNNAEFRGYTEFGGYAEFRGNAVFRGNALFRGNAEFRGNAVFFGEYLIILGDLIWSHASPLGSPEKTYINRVVPATWQREYYQGRLGMDISSGCYDVLCGKVLKRIVHLLQDEKWTPTERWMLETLRDSEKEPPTWVTEITEAKEEKENVY
jgi:hypothetical protein